MGVPGPPSGLSPDVALAYAGNAPGLAFRRPPNRLACEQRTGLNYLYAPYSPELLLTEPSASISQALRAQGQACRQSVECRLTAARPTTGRELKIELFKEGKVSHSLAP